MSKKKILWINPLVIDLYEPMKDYLNAAASEDTHVDMVNLERGPHHIEYYSYDSLVLPDTLKKIKQAEKDKYDAAIIGCFYDPGLLEAREISEKMCITAPAEASMHIASTLGHKFSIIVGRDKWIPKMMNNVVTEGFRDKLASFKSVGLGVNDFHRDEKLTEKLLKQAAIEAVEKDRAEVIILGCTMQFGFYKELERYLGVPVIDAMIAPLKYAEFLVELRQKIGWTHSKKGGYETPPTSEIKDWNLDTLYDMKGLWD